MARCRGPREPLKPNSTAGPAIAIHFSESAARRFASLPPNAGDPTVSSTENTIEYERSPNPTSSATELTLRWRPDITRDCPHRPSPDEAGDPSVSGFAQQPEA